MPTLFQGLRDAAPARLEAIGRFWDVELASSGPRKRAAELAAAMSSPEAIINAWNSLEPRESNALADLLARGGHEPIKVLTRRWGEIRTVGPSRMEREQPWRDPASAAEGLWYKGFVCRAFQQTPHGTYEAVFVPVELQSHLPTQGAPRPSVTPEPVQAPGFTQNAGDQFLDDACTLLAFVQTARPRPSSDTGWRTSDQAKLSRWFRCQESARLELVTRLLSDLAWIQTADDGRLRLSPGPVTAWLESPSADQREALAEAWLNTTEWNELFCVASLVAEQTGTWRNDPRLARRTVLRHLAACAPDVWYPIDGFVDGIREADPDFQRPDGNYASWYLRDAATGEYLTGFESWDEVEGAVIRYLLLAPLAWLGLVAPGGRAFGAPPTAFRLTPAGSAFVGLSDPPSDAATEAVSLLPDFTIRAPSGRRFERFQLARVADWLRSGDTYDYRLSPGSLVRAGQQGIGVDRVVEFLSRASDAPVPGVYESALTRWESHGSEAKLETVGLLRLASSELMDRALQTSATRRLLQEQVGPATAIALRRDWPRLVEALGRMGLLPEVVDDEE